MNDYVLTCCSTADMPKTYFEERTIPYVCFHFIMDGVTYPDDLGQSMPFDQFYRMLAEGSESLTSQVNVEEYKTFFELFLKKRFGYFAHQHLIRHFRLVSFCSNRER